MEIQEDKKPQISKFLLITLIAVLFMSGIVLAILGYQSTKDDSSEDQNTEAVAEEANSDTLKNTPEPATEPKDITVQSLDNEISTLDQEINSIDDENFSESTISDSEIGI